jgi:hypothetical protein
VVTMVSFSMSGMCRSQNRQFHHVRNVLDETDDNDTAHSIPYMLKLTIFKKTHFSHAEEAEYFNNDMFKAC